MTSRPYWPDTPANNEQTHPTRQDSPAAIDTHERSMMSYQPKPPTSRTPHNKSVRARDAENRGERTWTNWRQRDLIDAVLRVNRKGLTARELRAVRPFEALKVRLLIATEFHHVRLRIEELQTQMVQYYGINMKLAETLSARDVRKWSATRPSEEELDRMVYDKTGHLYYRQRR